MPTTDTYDHVDARMFRETIKPRARPAILRGLVSDWPAVTQGRTSPDAISAYLKAAYTGAPAPYFEAAPDKAGRFFYNDTLDGFNFEKKRGPLDGLLDRLCGADPAGLYAGALPVATYMPAFAAANSLRALIPAEAMLESIWIGNRTFIAPHYDNTENIACVVAGKRRFTLFPITQYPNMYVGPIDFTPAGQPVSLVDSRNPDLKRFPKFADAMAEAQVAELDPGDALYIPTLWWHGVESLSDFGVLVNYWWRDVPDWFGSCLSSLMSCVLSLKDLPPQQRDSWKAVFDYLIFQTDGAPLDHLPPEAQGLFGPLTPDNAARIRAYLARSFGG